MRKGLSKLKDSLAQPRKVIEVKISLAMQGMRRSY